LKDKILFPGVAYILVAVEAALQRFAGDGDITGVELRDISIRAPLFVPDTAVGVETIFSLMQLTDATGDSATWSMFRFTSHDVDENIWTEHCVGLVRVVKTRTTSPKPIFSEGLRSTTASSDAQDRYFTRSIDATKMYEDFASAGMDFGEVLRNIRDLKLSEDGAACVGHVSRPDIPVKAHDRYSIHPCTFESILHALLVLCNPDSGVAKNPMVANRIEHVWISNPLHDATAESYKMFAETARTTATVYKSDAVIYEQGFPEPILSIKGLDLVLLPPQDKENEEDSFYTEIWKPDVKMLTRFGDQRELRTLDVSSIKALTADDHEEYQLASAVFILNSLEKLAELSVPDLPFHLRAFVRYMERQSRLITEGSSPFVDLAKLNRIRGSEELEQILFQEVAKKNARGELLIRVGNHILPILKQETDSLELMFASDDLMERTYEEGLPGDIGPVLAEYLDYLTHNQSGVRILEVGGGTGSATKVILDALRKSGKLETESGVPPITSYDFTDISSAFFEKAQQRFPEWSEVFRCQTFDVEKDPALQGFEIGSYDLVIATHVSLASLYSHYIIMIQSVFRN
jgi:hypothetical protein